MAGTWFAVATSAAVSMVVGGALRNAVGGRSGGGGGSSFVAQASGRDQIVRSGVANRTLVYGRAMVSGPLVFAASSGASNGTLHLVIPLAGHEIDGIEDIYFNEVALGVALTSGAPTAAVASGVYAGKANFTLHSGTAGQAANAELVALGAGWTTAHTLSGVAYLVVRLTFDKDVFPTGIPNVKCIVRGKKLYDPRTGLTTWSANPALQVRDYLTSNYGLEATAGEIDDTLVVAAANVCDESVAILPSGTEARYTGNGVVDLGDTPRTIMEAVLSGMAGFVVWSGGKYLVYPGAYSAPAVTITADDLRGPLRVRPRISRRDLYNAVRGTFVSPAVFWQPTDFPTVSNAAYATQDGGQVIWRDVALPFTTSSATAQRIAKLMLERSRQGITVEMSAKLTTFKVATLDTVMVTLPQLGWAAKEFKVLEWTFAPEGGVDLVLQEETAASYNWNSGLQTVVDPAPDTNLGDPLLVQAPGNPAIAESLYQTTGSAGVKSRATVTWAAVADVFVRGYLVDYKLAADATWTLLPEVRTNTVDLPDLAPGIYEFRLRAVSTLGGVRSPYSGTTTKELLGLTAAPGDVAGFSVTKVGGVAMGSWALTGDLDVRIGGRVVVRHSPQTTGATWADGVILEEFAGDSVSGLLPLMTGTYMIKAKDSTATYSTNAASFVATEGLVTGFTVVANSTQDPTFAGAKTNCTVLTSALQITSGLTAIYDFTTYLDMTTVATRRVEADIKALSFDTSALFDSKTELIDTWDDIDGGVVNDCDATLYYAATNDNPAGTPVWGPWTPFFVADVTCRALKFRLDLLSGDNAHNIAVSTLRVDVKNPV
jgi:hypothetical protein